MEKKCQKKLGVFDSYCTVKQQIPGKCGVVKLCSLFG